MRVPKHLMILSIGVLAGGISTAGAAGAAGAAPTVADSSSSTQQSGAPLQGLAQPSYSPRLDLGRHWAAQVVGDLLPSEPIQLSVNFRIRNQASLATQLAAPVGTTDAIEPQQVGLEYGATAAEMNSVVAYLQSQG